MADQLLCTREPEAAVVVEVRPMELVGIPLHNCNNLHRILTINSATDKKANVRSHNNGPTLSLQYHLFDSEQLILQRENTCTQRVHGDP